MSQACKLRQRQQVFHTHRPRHRSTLERRGPRCCSFMPTQARSQHCLLPEGDDIASIHFLYEGYQIPPFSTTHWPGQAFIVHAPTRRSAIDLLITAARQLKNRWHQRQQSPASGSGTRSGGARRENTHNGSNRGLRRGKSQTNEINFPQKKKTPKGESPQAGFLGGGGEKGPVTYVATNISCPR